MLACLREALTYFRPSSLYQVRAVGPALAELFAQLIRETVSNCDLSLSSNKGSPDGIWVPTSTAHSIRENTSLKKDAILSVFKASWTPVLNHEFKIALAGRQTGGAEEVSPGLQGLCKKFHSLQRKTRLS